MENFTWNITIKQIFEDNYEEFKSLHWEYINSNIEENVQKILICRDTEKLGCTIYQCPNHPEHIVKIPHSCKSRFCNTCWKIKTDEWIASCNQLLPNVNYRHLTLTIPEELRNIFYENKDFLNCLFQWAKEMLLSFFTEKLLIPAITMVRHTFWRRLNWNPHLHIIVSAWWLTKEWNWKEQDYIPYKMLSKRWKVKLLHSIENKINEIIQNPDLKSKEQFNWIINFKNNILKSLYSKKWYTNLSWEKIDMIHTVWYIWRYSRRPVISEAKILEYSKNKKTIKFEYKDHKQNAIIKYTLSVFDFIKLLIQHIPERYNHQIRHYWLVANRVSAFFKNILNKLFWKAKKMLTALTWRFRKYKYTGKDPLICPHCNSELFCLWMGIFSKKENKIIYI